MADNNNVNSVVDSLLKGLEGFATAKTVVGEAIHVNDTIILPLVDVSFGIGAGAALNEEKKKNNGGGGMGAKMSPSAVLLIQNGVPRLINIKKNRTGINRHESLTGKFRREIQRKNRQGQ